jgi:cobalt-zinc-cadmium efflux system outer membrane protein
MVGRSALSVWIVAMFVALPVAAEEGDLQAQPVTLDELLEFAHQNAPALRVSAERRKLGDAALAGATRVSVHNPELEGELGVGLDAEETRFEATILQRIEIAGQRGLRVKAARRQQDVLGARYAAAEWTLHEQVHALFRLGLIDRRRVEVERQIHEFTEELLRVARERYEAGEEPRTSVIVTRAERARARQRLVQRRLELVQTLRALAEVSGWNADRPPLPQGNLLATRALPPTERLVERAWSNDPQSVVLEREKDAEAAGLALARRLAWPDPVLGVGWEQEGAGTDTHNILRFVVGVPLPLWNRNQGEVARSHARIGVLGEQLAARKVELRNRVRRKAAAVEGAARQLKIFEEEVLPSFAEQLGLLQDGFRLGEMDLLDVMTARDRLLEAQREALDARQRYVEAVSQLEALLGVAIWEDHQ